jgi:hypothetical protein
VDQARAVYEVEDVTQPWIEGEPESQQELGPWFACRLTVAEPTEGTGIAGMRGLAGRGYHRLEGTAKLLMLNVFVDGSSVTDDTPGIGHFIAFDDGMMLQVKSTASPDEVWHVASGIMPIRKKRGRAIGYQCELRRAREPRVTTGVLPAAGTPEPEPLVGVVRERARGILDIPPEDREVGY